MGVDSKKSTIRMLPADAPLQSRGSARRAAKPQRKTLEAKRQRASF